MWPKDLAADVILVVVSDERTDDFDVVLGGEIEQVPAHPRRGRRRRPCALRGCRSDRRGSPSRRRLVVQNRGRWLRPSELPFKAGRTAGRRRVAEFRRMDGCAIQFERTLNTLGVDLLLRAVRFSWGHGKRSRPPLRRRARIGAPTRRRAERRALPSQRRSRVPWTKSVGVVQRKRTSGSLWSGLSWG